LKNEKKKTLGQTWDLENEKIKTDHHNWNLELPIPDLKLRTVNLENQSEVSQLVPHFRNYRIESTINLRKQNS
jgi:hypothetical protein